MYVSAPEEEEDDDDSIPVSFLFAPRSELVKSTIALRDVRLMMGMGCMYATSTATCEPDVSPCGALSV